MGRSLHSCWRSWQAGTWMARRLSGMTPRLSGSGCRCGRRIWLARRSLLTWMNGEVRDLATVCYYRCLAVCYRCWSVSGFSRDLMCLSWWTLSLRLSLLRNARSRDRCPCTSKGNHWSLWGRRGDRRRDGLGCRLADWEQGILNRWTSLLLLKVN